MLLLDQLSRPFSSTLDATAVLIQGNSPGKLRFPFGLPGTGEKGLHIENISPSVVGEIEPGISMLEEKKTTPDFPSIFKRDFPI